MRWLLSTMVMIMIAALLLVPIACETSQDDEQAMETTVTESSSAVVSQEAVSGQYEPAVAPIALYADDIDPNTQFALNAFPPTVPDTDWHQEAWYRDDCLRCHETGVGDAPMIYHRGMSPILLKAKCRSCHVLIPGQMASSRPVEPEESMFESYAFPPMMPNTEHHKAAWGNNDCMLCHEDGVQDAPIVKHDGMPRILLKAKCRSCHVQIRSDETSPWDE